MSFIYQVECETRFYNSTFENKNFFKLDAIVALSSKLGKLQNEYKLRQNQFNQEKSWIWWASRSANNAKKEELTRRWREIKELQQNIENMKNQKREKEGIWSNMFFDDVIDHGKKMLLLIKEIIEAFLFWETLELALISSYSFSSYGQRDVDPTENEETTSSILTSGISTSGAILVAILLGFYLAVGAILWILFFSVTLPFLVVKYQPNVFEFVVSYLLVEFGAILLVTLYQVCLAGIGIMGYVHFVQKK